MNDRRAPTMTIGTLSRRTGVPVKALREYEDLGLIYSLGRSEGNYRLFDDDALWCVTVIEQLRGLGLSLAEVRELAAVYLTRTDDPVGPRLAQVLHTARDRTQRRIAELQAVLERIAAYEAEFQNELAGRADFRATDPHFAQS